MQMITVSPNNRCWWLRLRLQSPLSHHDPDNTDKSNRNLFRRVAKVIKTDVAGNRVTQEQVDRILNAYPVPQSMADLFAEATLQQFLGTALMYEFISRYNGKDGTGLFSGIERYRRLEERFKQSAVQSHSLMDLWGFACDSLQVPTAGDGNDFRTLTLLNAPAQLAGQVIKTMIESPRPLVMLARLWADAARNGEATVALQYAPPSPTESQEMIVEMPTFSANSARHELIREPGMWHLFNKLNIAFDEPMPAMTAMFYNGGDIKSGASQPSDVFWLRGEVRRQYPLLALLSGGTDSFLLGESNLRVHSWVRCRENNDVLKGVGLDSHLSIFDLTDDWTLTRHANRVESGQMPFGFETLIENSEIIVRLSVTPYADELQIGALMASLRTYQGNDSTIGGQSARGFGLTDLRFHDSLLDEQALAAYEEYLTQNATILCAGITEGHLATGKVLVSG